MFIYCLVLQVLNLAYCIYQHLTVVNSEAINLVLAANSFLIMVVWTFLKCVKKSLTLYVPVIYMIIHSIDINVLFWDKLHPASLNVTNKKQYDDQFLYYFLMANVGNFMDIKKTVLLFVPVYLCGYIAQLKREAMLLNAEDPLVSS